ncbi:MAG: hypothetical protein ACK5LP_03445 [Campylobacteraceae bacterium]
MKIALIIAGVIICFYIMYILFFKVAASRTYDLNRWSGRLWKWADENSVSPRKLPRYNEEYLLKVKELDISDKNFVSLPEEITNINLVKLTINKGINFSPKQKEWLKSIKELKEI